MSWEQKKKNQKKKHPPKKKIKWKEEVDEKEKVVVTAGKLFRSIHKETPALTNAQSMTQWYSQLPGFRVTQNFFLKAQLAPSSEFQILWVWVGWRICICSNSYMLLTLQV